MQLFCLVICNKLKYRLGVLINDGVYEMYFSIRILLGEHLKVEFILFQFFQFSTNWLRFRYSRHIYVLPDLRFCFNRHLNSYPICMKFSIMLSFI